MKDFEYKNIANKITFSYDENCNELDIEAEGSHSCIIFSMNKENVINLKAYIEKVLKIMASNAS